MRFSVIIPVYNRPQELDELLTCLTNQAYNNFEVLVIEDGSSIKANDVVAKYKDHLDIHYFEKENGGQGFARNYAFERAKGDFFIILDSDALIESDYLDAVFSGIEKGQLDIFGGPDKDHPSFTAVQKAISFAMTSLFTTGGIRGKEKNVGVNSIREVLIWVFLDKFGKLAMDLKSHEWVKTSNSVFAVFL